MIRKNLLIWITVISSLIFVIQLASLQLSGDSFDRDFAIDFLYACAVCAMHLSRLAEDFIILKNYLLLYNLKFQKKKMLIYKRKYGYLMDFILEKIL